MVSDGRRSTAEPNAHSGQTRHMSRRGVAEVSTTPEDPPCRRRPSGATFGRRRPPEQPRTAPHPRRHPLRRHPRFDALLTMTNSQPEHRGATYLEGSATVHTDAINVGWYCRARADLWLVTHLPQTLSARVYVARPTAAWMKGYDACDRKGEGDCIAALLGSAPADHRPAGQVRLLDTSTSGSAVSSSCGTPTASRRSAP